MIATAPRTRGCAPYDRRVLRLATEGRGGGLGIADNPRFAGLISLRTTEDACDVIRVRSVPAAFNQPVRSRVPVLVYGDDYDPVTPPANSRRAARTLRRSTFVATHGLGHGVALKNECTLGIFSAFLADPTAPVDISCAKEMLGPAWVV